MDHKKPHLQRNALKPVRNHLSAAGAFDAHKHDIDEAVSTSWNIITYHKHIVCSPVCQWETQGMKKFVAQ